MQILAQSIAAAEFVFGRLFYVNFAYPEALAIGQHREKPVLVSVKLNLIGDFSFEESYATAEVIILLATEKLEEEMKGFASNRFKGSACPGPTVADGKIAIIKRGDQIND